MGSVGLSNPAQGRFQYSRVSLQLWELTGTSSRTSPNVNEFLSKSQSFDPEGGQGKEREGREELQGCRHRPTAACPEGWTRRCSASRGEAFGVQGGVRSALGV